MAEHAAPGGGQPTRHRQRFALRRAYPEVPTPHVELPRCDLRRVRMADGPDGLEEDFEIVVARDSGLTFRFVRSLKKAIYGEVWDALEVKLHSIGDQGSSVPFYSKVLDEHGNVRRLAVKRMPWDIINEKLGTILENPLHEIALLTLVQDPGHPNVVGLVEALDDGTTVYMATPYVGGDGGGELFDWVADNYLTPAPEDVIRPLLWQIVDGVRYIHSKGVCHADMSLENTLVDAEHANAFIIDFGMGLQMPMDEHGRRYMSLPDGRQAKRSYCAPETFKRKPYDAVKVDVFSAGCMGFMMFTGIPPFDYATRADPKFKRVVYEGDIQGYLRDCRMPPLPDEVFDLLRWMMAYNADDRPLPEEVLEHPWFEPLREAQQQETQPPEPPESPPPVP